MRIIVQRILQGYINTRDIEALLFWLRERNSVGWYVKDIADFLAHDEKRDKGAALKLVSEAQTILEFHIGLAYSETDGIDNNRLRDLFEKAVYSGIETVPSGLSSKVFDVEKGAARKLAREYFARTKDKPFEFPPTHFLNRPEAKVIMFATRSSYLPIGYNSKDLFNQFCEDLVKNGVLKDEEKTSFLVAENLLSLLAIERMHNSILKIGKVARISLRLRVFHADGYLRVSATHKINFQEDNISIVWPVFSNDTELPSSLRRRTC